MADSALTIAMALVLFFWATVIHSVCLDESPSDERFTRLCLEDWNRNRTYALSEDSPIASTLSKHPLAVLAIQQLVLHFETAAGIVYDMHKHPPRLFEQPKKRACNINEHESSVKSVKESLSRYGWGILQTECVTELADTFSMQTKAAFEVYFGVVYRSATAIAEAVNRNWPNASAYARFNYKDELVQCELRHMVGWYVDGKWAVNTGITNESPSTHLIDFNREYAVEILRVKDNAVEAQKLTLPLFPSTANWSRNATTLLARWGGAPQASLFSSYLDTDEVPAVNAALALGKDIRDQVETTTTVAGVAILILPLFLSLLPVAAFADVGPGWSLLYTLITDLLSAFPLAIKGFELKKFAHTTYTATRTWMYGAILPKDLACAETWHASCNANGHLIILYRIFIATAFTTMVLGVVLELLFYHRLRRQKHSHVEKLNDYHSPHIQMWQCQGFCYQCRCVTTWMDSGSSSGSEKQKWRAALLNL